MPIKEDKKPKRWPPDMMLASSGHVKRLWDRISAQKDTVIKRMANGKAVLGTRKPIPLSGENSRIDTEVILLRETAIGHYISKDCNVYVVMVDLDKFHAEALKNGEHLWNAEERSAEQLLHVIYNLFPKNKPTQVQLKTNIADMSIEELQAVLKRKSVVEEKNVFHGVPSANISAEEIKAASDPLVIEREKAIEEQKSVQA